ncbi:MAG: sugar transferase [Acidimicrobiia bacterium]|nr:sugar transferase [Acidimicrobiia bacterium]
MARTGAGAAVDLAVTVLVGPVALVVGLVCAVAVKSDSRGPVLFRQERVGLDGQRFQVAKFRTMVDDPEGNPLFPDDDRIRGSAACCVARPSTNCRSCSTWCAAR